MIQFKEVTLSDKKDIDACLLNNPYRASDFCFTNLFVWNIKFKTTFAIENNTIFIRFKGPCGQMFYLMPIGKMPLRNAFELIKKDAADNGIAFQMKAITTRMWDDIQAQMPDEYIYTRDRDNDEYIYTSEKLITLSGKKLQSKRNHINRFKLDNPDWEYFPLTSRDELDECLEMLTVWDEHKNKDDEENYDFLVTKNMLDNFDKLELRGGAIRVNGKIVAFTLGEPLTKDSFVVHVEKAFGDINGAYSIINQEFVKHEAANFTYINREEDMGIESLRKAKMSYYPDILLQEGALIEKK